MQNKVKIFQLILFIPVLFWLVAKPITLFSAEKTAVKTEKKGLPAKATVYAEQHVFQVSSTPQVDFPTDFVFTSLPTIPLEKLQKSIKLPSILHRTQFMRILLTQFIATLAP
jgi:hypothetical protein